MGTKLRRSDLNIGSQSQAHWEPLSSRPLITLCPWRIPDSEGGIFSANFTFGEWLFL